MFYILFPLIYHHYPVHGKTTYDWHTMTYKNIRWHTTYKWYADDMRVHKSDIRMIYEWHMDDIQVHMSDIQMTYTYIRVTYGWHAITYEWHTNGIRVHIDKIQARLSDIRMTCVWHEYVQVPYKWHTTDMQIT